MTRQILPVPNPVTSYWLSEPHPHADLRSAPRLPQRCDVAVVGAGLAGVLSAYHVLKKSSEDGDAAAAGDGEKSRGLDVVLLDARQLCSGATGRNGGHVKGRKRSDLQDYVERVMFELKSIVEEEGLECEFELRRSYDVFTDASEAEDIHAWYEDARKKGEAWTRNVSWIGEQHAEQLASIIGAKGAFSVPAASFWPYKFVTQLLAAMLKKWEHRLNVQMNTPITHLTSSPNTQTLATPRGPLTATNLILATNTYTAGLLPTFKHALTPVRGMASHHRPKTPQHPHLACTYNIAPAWRGNFDDAHLFPKRVTGYWRGYMARRFWGWEESEAEADFVWTGIMGRTDDGEPFVGRVPGRRGVCVLVGFNGGEMAVVALCARAVGSMVVRGEGFEEVWREEGLLEGLGVTEERLGGASRTTG
ncbi:FAD dependent oxidoreductase [Lizonia empirigonia]|nr:FAD dependent oxidoreductase [Lizonia empirigonia]